MRTFPKRLTRDEVSVETFAGTGAHGPVYKAAEEVACRVQMTRQLVRDANGKEVVSEVTIYMDPDEAAKFTVGSRVTVDDHVTDVLGVSTHGRPGQAVVAKAVCK